MTEPGATMTAEPGDHDLMARLAGGDDLALNALMKRWSGRLISYFQRMTGSHDTAVDLAQETFVKLYQARARYRPLSGGFSTWMFTIASNLAKNHARWRARHPEVALDPPELEAAKHPDLTHPHGTSPDREAISRESEAQVRRAILALPDELREALLLSVHEQLGHAEIARIAGCSPKAVETRIYRARQILKERLQHLRA